MIVIFALVLSILAITADARSAQKVKVFKIVLDPETDEFSDHEAQNKVKIVEDTPRSEAQNLALQLMSEIDMLLGSQHSDPSSSEGQDSFIDETRSSIVVMPTASNKVYHIDIVKPEARDKTKNRSKNWIKRLLERKEPEPEPAMTAIKGVPRTNQLYSMHLLSEILGTQSPSSSSESQEHSVFDETRSSVLVMPPESNKVYHIVRDTIKTPEGSNRPTKSSTEWEHNSKRDDSPNNYEIWPVGSG